ncbi:MAG: hypothetical protein WC840_04645 [Candidatus Peribacteraceae bacterium]
MTRFLRPALALALWSFAFPAWAYMRISINTGVHSNVPSIMNGIVNVLLEWSSLVATALFLLGCLFLVGSGGNEQYSSAGKKIMKASLIGLAIILASWLIISTMVFFIAA